MEDIVLWLNQGQHLFLVSDFFCHKLLPFLLTINQDSFGSLDSTVVDAWSFLKVETVDHTLQHLEM